MSAAVEPPQRPPAAPGAGAAPAAVGPSDAGGSGGGAPPPDLIFPPADMRGVIEKTAQFVAKNGAEFESRVLREQSATKFGFLLPNNPYHAFYKLKVREFTTGEAAPTPQVPQAIRDMQQKQQQQKQKQQQLLMLTQIGESEKEGAKQKLEPPPPNQFVLQHPWVAPVDLDIIRCCAQFVARNGQKFLAGLAQREQQNPQFAFLKPSHHLFSYFASLVDAYTKCLLPQKETLEALRETASDRQALLARVRRRMQYERQQLKQRQEKESKSQEERRLMMSLDWESFHIVETIEFTEEDERLPLAAPIDFTSAPKELPKALLADDQGAADAAADAAAGDQTDSIAKLIEGADADAEDEAMETEDEEDATQQQPESDKMPPEAQDGAAAEAAAAAQQQDVCQYNSVSCLASSFQLFIVCSHAKLHDFSLACVEPVRKHSCMNASKQVLGGVVARCWSGRNVVEAGGPMMRRRLYRRLFVLRASGCR